MKSCVIYFVLALLLLVPGSGTLPLMDRDEPKFAQATWEMMETGQWTVPYFNGEYRFDKPPFTYWWMRAHYWILGKTELAARLHSIFAAWLAAFVISRMGAFLFSEKAGFYAGLGFLTCLQVLVHGRLCVADMPMILAVIATMDASARLAFAESEPKRFGPLFWYLLAALAFGFLAKGPIAWAVPILAWLLYWWPFGRRSIPWRRFQPFSAFGIALIIVAIWGIPAMISTNWEYYKVGIGTNVIDRGLESFNGRINIPVIYYLGTAFVSLLPWSAFGRRALLSGERFRDNPKRALLMAWFVSPFIIFVAYATQLPHYILPGFGGFFLLLFKDGKLPELKGKWEHLWYWSVVGIFVLVSVVGAVFLLAKPLPAPVDSMMPVIWLGLGIVTAVGVVAPILLKQLQGRKGIIGAVTVIALTACILVPLMTSAIRERHPAVILNDRFFKEQPEGTEFAAFDYNEPSLVFYHPSPGGWKLYGGDVKPIKKWLEESPSNRVAVLRTKAWRIGDGFVKKDFKPVVDRTAEVMAVIDPSTHRTETIAGFNVARTTWEEVVIAIPK